MSVYGALFCRFEHNVARKLTEMITASELQSKWDGELAQRPHDEEKKSTEVGSSNVAYVQQ